MPRHTIENDLLALTVDEKGRIVSLINKATQTELVTYPEDAEAWRMILPAGRHRLDFVYGSLQTPAAIDVSEQPAGQRLTISYDAIRIVKTRYPLADAYPPSLFPGREEVAELARLPIRASFILELADAEIRALVEIENTTGRQIDEVEFPVVRGMGGFAQDAGRVMNLIASRTTGAFYGDVLNGNLPVTGTASGHFGRADETSMFMPTDGPYQDKGCWVELYGKEQGLYLGYHPTARLDFAFKLEKYPKETPCLHGENGPVHYYPKGTPRFLRAFAIHVPQLKAGESWTSQQIVVMPHKSDWHAGADRYSSWRHEGLKIAEPPNWAQDFVGWSEIIGNLYTGEVFHDFTHCAEAMAKEKQVSDIDLVFYYGHTNLGAEGADYDHSPSEEMGGETGFRAMVENLHANGIRIILLDHLHTYVNKDVPEYAALNLEQCAAAKEDGALYIAHWWKETFLSCQRMAGPTPTWVGMCPGSERWLQHYLDHVTKMIERGVDGLELDCFDAFWRCYNTEHGHAPGAFTQDLKMDFMRTVRAHAKALNPDFILIGETMSPEAREVLDGYYPGRYLGDNDCIYRYMFPELRIQSTLVGNYAYDQVNKALQYGIGAETEIWGLRMTGAAACPELADYMGKINRLKRKYGDILIRGTFRDTVGATVDGGLSYSVLEGPNGTKALVLRNPTRQVQKGTAATDTAGKRLVMWQRKTGEQPLASLPVTVEMGPYEAAVVLALGD